jgi:hypothetical protein
MSDLSPAQTASIPPKAPPAPTERWGPRGLETEDIATGSFFAHGGPASFSDFLDIINPLQHLPVISSIYRAITGDEIGAGARAVGGMIYGGPVGMIAAGVTAMFEEASGGNVVTHIASLVRDVTGGDGEAPAATAAENPDDVRSAAQKAAAVEPAAGPAPVQAAAVALPAAAANRIAFRPGAPLGVPQAPPTAQAPAAVQAAVLQAAQPQATAAAASRGPAFAARPAALQFASSAAPPAFPAHPGRQPSHAVAGDRSPAQQQRANPAVSQARQSQADRMLAQWAAQQVALQNARMPPPAAEPSEPAAGRTAEPALAGPAAIATPAPAAAHPMLAPQNASPDWYVRAMGAALNKYEAAQGLGTGPALAGQSALPR